MSISLWMKTRILHSLLALAIITGILTGCLTSVTSNPDQGRNQGGSNQTIRLTLAAYTTPREAYRELIPLFQSQWREKTGQEVVFEESYLASGAQSRAIVEGFEADIAALSLQADINRIERAGLITHDWRDNAYDGMVSTSIVAFAVRPGNPHGIRDWADLAKPGLQVLTPNPKTSGGAMWNVLALYGAARRGYVEGVQAGDDSSAQQFLLSVLKNVRVMDKGARESITNFEQGVGDVAITYENEVLVGQHNGQSYELVIPHSTILIENPIAVVDAYVDKHKTREAAEAFVDFLFGHTAQDIFARHGLRSPDPEISSQTIGDYPPVEDLFTIGYFGGWDQAIADFFSDQGIYAQTIARTQGQ
jgi:sulfate/thiosulfate transport system substrate-binding protein